MSKKLQARTEMATEYTWDLTPIIKDEKMFDETFAKVKELVDTFSTYAGNLLSSPKTLLEALHIRNEIFENFTRLYVFSKMTLDQDTKLGASQERFQLISSYEGELSTKLSFFDPEIMSADPEILKGYIETHEGLKLYEHYFHNLLRKKDHVLSAEMEELLALSSDFSSTPGAIYTMYNNADLELPMVIDENHEEIRLTQGNFIRLLKSSDRKVRETAFHAMYDERAKLKNTIASIFTANLKKDTFHMKARKFDSALDANLFDRNIDTSVYHNLVNTVGDNLHLMHRYVDLRKKVLGFETLHMYDLYVPIVSDVDEVIPYEEAKKTVLEALQPMGKEYVDMIQHAYDNKWIDVYENIGKRSGAYSWGAYGSHPYVLLNHQDNMSSMFTLAHELGHAMHSHYSSNTQEYIYHGYPIFLAEVASTVNEALLLQHLLKTTTEKQKRLYLINHYLESFRATFFRQAMFAEFELTVHNLCDQGQPLTADNLCDIYLDMNKKYYGDNIVIDDHIKYEWMRIPHFYNSFYVYQYSTGFASAQALSKGILDEVNGKATAVGNLEKYMGFLKAGSSDYPLNTLKSAGVDMSTPTPIQDALAIFEGLLDEFESMM